MRSKAWSGCVAALILLAVPVAAEVQPQGRELRVNRRIDFKQLNPASAFSPSGGAVVVWENDQRGIRGLFYAPGGWPSGAEATLVGNQAPASVPFSGPVVYHRQPAAAFLANGQFLLAFTEERGFLRSEPFFEQREVHDRDIFVQRFSVGGAPLGEKVRVNTTLAGFQQEPRLIAQKGGFLAVWEDGSTGGIVGRALNGSGQPVGAEIEISESDGLRPAVAANSKGQVLVTWDGNDGNALGIFARVLDADAKPVGPEFRVNTDTAFRQARPAVAADKAGNFLVVWQGEHPELWVGFFYLYGQTVGAGGNLIGPQVRLYRGSLGDGSPQIAPSLTAMPGGHFLLAWLTWKDGTDFQAAGVELNALGSPIGEGFWITERGVQRNFRDIALAGDGAGKFLAAWETAERRRGINARRLGADD
jgi:hypothetical protein